MGNKLEFSENKSFRLNNVLEVLIDSENFVEFNVLVENMEHYIRSKGAMPVGPLIQKTEFEILETGEIDVKIYLMRQADKFICNVTEPYKMSSVIKAKNCLYVRYTGPEDKLKFAYDKINLFAFEKDIELKNVNYTIFVNQEDEDMVADVFVEKVGND